jgi:hypothetical protein
MIRIEFVAARTSPAMDRLLAAVTPARRPLARQLMTDPRCGGHGLRAWLAMLAAGHGPLPPRVPGEVVEVYLSDDAAEPLHDCEKCGLAVPVRATRRYGHEAAVEREYFPNCPCCGGRTGRHAYWSCRAEAGSN